MLKWFASFEIKAFGVFFYRVCLYLTAIRYKTAAASSPQSRGTSLYSGLCRPFCFAQIPLTLALPKIGGGSA